MKLTERQRRAFWLMGEALGELSDCWDDELGELLSAHKLLPGRCVLEANRLYISFAAGGAVPAVGGGNPA
ncbi:hypothetical protein ACTHPH_21960 [Paenibacillus pasadenensis]